jgi:Predicted AAA-ATPase
MVDLMRSILGRALKDNSYMHKAVITGITRISQESLFSGLNNIEVYSVLRVDHGQYFGFTENEVNKLIQIKN